jgi:hypothetical protein
MLIPRQEVKSSKEDGTGANSEIEVEISVSVASVGHRVIWDPKWCSAFGELETKRVGGPFLGNILQLLSRWIGISGDVHRHQGILRLVPE